MTLILEQVPKDCMDRTLQPGMEDITPSESSEAESSTASSVPEDDEEAWESGPSLHPFFRAFFVCEVRGTRKMMWICVCSARPYAAYCARLKLLGCGKYAGGGRTLCPMSG